MSNLDLFRYQSYFQGIDQNRSTYIDNEVPACTYTARVIQEALQAENIASKIIWVTNKQDQTGHAYIVLDSQKDDEQPYNLSPLGRDQHVTVGEVRKTGEDITAEILNEPWSRL